MIIFTGDHMEKYRYVRIKGKDAEFFAGLDPYEKLRLTESKAGFAIGVLKEHEEDLSVAGLLCGLVLADSISIEWMAVSPEDQGMGIGENLLIRAFKMAKKGAREKLTTIIPKDYEKEAALKFAHGFFEERLFTEKNKICADVEGSLSEFSAKESGQGFTVEPLTSFDRNEELKKLSAIVNATYSVDIMDIRSQIDADVSFVAHSDKGELEGALLIQRAGNLMIPVYHYAKSEKVSLGLMQASIKETAIKYGKETSVYITARQEETKEIIKKVYSKTSDATLLTAHIKDFDREVDLSE